MALDDRAQMENGCGWVVVMQSTRIRNRWNDDHKKIAQAGGIYRSSQIARRFCRSATTKVQCVVWNAEQAEAYLQQNMWRLDNQSINELTYQLGTPACRALMRRDDERRRSATDARTPEIFS